MFNSNLSFDDEWFTLNFTLKIITLPIYGHMLFLMLKIIHAFLTSTLDYSNALLSRCPAGSINKLQLVQNAADKELARAKKHQPHFIVSIWQPVTPTLSLDLWLPHL